MRQLARKLMSLKTGEVEPDESRSYRDILMGSELTVTKTIDDREKIRIAVYPIICSENPKMAMGLMTLLALLLDHWQEIRVYPLMVAVPPQAEPQNYQWTVNDSQFVDYDLEGLDHNASIRGTLNDVNNSWQLTLNIDFDEKEQVKVLAYVAPDVAGLVNQLPQIATDIAEELEANQANITHYAETSTYDDRLIVLLNDIFEWQRRLYLSLWGQPFPENAIHQYIEKLTESGKVIDDEFAAWSVASVIAHAMQPGYEAVADSVTALCGDVVNYFQHSYFGAIYIGTALFEKGFAQQAYNLLESAVEKHPKHPTSWITLADLYRRGGHAHKMIDAFQRAIEEEAANSLLYRNYAAVLQMIDPALVQTFILIDPAEYDGNYIVWEAIEAYKEVEKLEPDDLVALRQRAMLLLDLGEINAFFIDPEDTDEFFNVFEKLVKADATGVQVRAIIENLYLLDNIEVAIDILEEQLEQYPDRVDLVLNLAMAFIVNEEEDFALEELDRARTMSDDPIVLNDIEYLTLLALNPNFEAEMGEIQTLVNAGSKLSSGQLAFLQEAINTAPGYVDAYVTLANAYLLEDDLASAIEVLLDGEVQIPNDAEILLTLSRALWQAGQIDEAFKYLEKGIEANPKHVPLLALMGQYLFEDDDEDEARLYLMRAESINPRHPALAAARKRIVDLIASRK
ncbi:MAG: tetratricopeptide repeat protein [Chloroflexi bacterium]|nr:MAG: tetratricopeptide repeat protein [Chloroflexota bacterium]